MRLQFLGHAAFDLTLLGVRLCLDPHKPGALGGRFQLPAIVGPFDALVHTHWHEDHAAWTPELGTTLVLDSPQEFRDIEVQIRPVFHDAVGGTHMGMVRMVSLTANGLRIVHCGDIGAFDDHDVAWLANTDVLLIPAGGTYTLDGRGAAALAVKTGARCVIPMHCADPRVAIALANVQEFGAAWPFALRSMPQLTDADLATISEPTAVVLSAP